MSTQPRAQLDAAPPAPPRPLHMPMAQALWHALDAANRVTGATPLQVGLEIVGPYFLGWHGSQHVCAKGLSRFLERVVNTLSVCQEWPDMLRRQVGRALQIYCEHLQIAQGGGNEDFSDEELRVVELLHDFLAVATSRLDWLLSRSRAPDASRPTNIPTAQGVILRFNQWDRGKDLVIEGGTIVRTAEVETVAGWAFLVLLTRAACEVRRHAMATSR